MTNGTQNELEIEDSFRKDLQELLNKYDATLSADDHFTGYTGCGADVRMTVEIGGTLGVGGKWRNIVNINLGNYLSPIKK